jgi:hypothetical protein
MMLLEKGKLAEESETPVLGERNPPKNSKIPWRNQEVTNGAGGSWVTCMVEPERRGVKRD